MIGINIGNIIHFIIISYLNYKIFKFKLNYKKIILLYSSFFIALLSTLIMEVFFLGNINYSIINALNLQYFQNFQFLSLGVFLLIFIFLIICFKTFSIADIEYLEFIFNRDNIIDKFIRKGLTVLKKFMRD